MPQSLITVPVQGRVDEAIALLHTRQCTSVNNRDQLADLLARQGRIEELRAYAGSDPHGHAVCSLAEVLEARGDLDGAIAVYRQPDGLPISLSHMAPALAPALAALLVQNGRVDERIEVMRTLAESPGRAEDWTVDMLCTLYADHAPPTVDSTRRSVWRGSTPRVTSSSPRDRRLLSADKSRGPLWGERTAGSAVIPGV